jgi:hypothetical protein
MTGQLIRPTLRACAARAAQIIPGLEGSHSRTDQLAAYLAIVELELSASDVRRALEWTRDEVDAACLEIEELRETLALDEAIATAGVALRSTFRRAPARPSRTSPCVADLNAQRTARAARRALELLLAAAGGIVGHAAFGSVCSARTAICAARKEVGRSAIRTVRGRGFCITKAGIRAAQAMDLGRFGERADSRKDTRLPNQISQKAAA